MHKTKKQLLRIFVHWFVPPGLAAFFKRKVRWHLVPRDLRRGIENNKAFKNIHKGQRCFILATGPSIATQDLTQLADETCIAVSDFHLHPQAGAIDPEYCVNAPMHAPFDVDAIKVSIGGARRVFSSDTRYFFGHVPYQYSWHSVFRANSALMPMHTHYINYSGSSRLDEFNFRNPGNWDLAGTPFNCMTVVFSAIQLAVYMGFSKIYLLGCDHDYLQRIIRGQGFDDHHFYQDRDAGLKGAAQVLESFTLEQWFEQYYFRWMQYRLMLEYARENGQEIVNATNGGMLDVFPRARLDEVLSFK